MSSFQNQLRSYEEQLSAMQAIQESSTRQMIDLQKQNHKILENLHANNHNQPAGNASLSYFLPAGQVPPINSLTQPLNSPTLQQSTHSNSPTQQPSRNPPTIQPAGNASLSYFLPAGQVPPINSLTQPLNSPTLQQSTHSNSPTQQSSRNPLSTSPENHLTVFNSPLNPSGSICDPRKEIEEDILNSLGFPSQQNLPQLKIQDSDLMQMVRKRSYLNKLASLEAMLVRNYRPTH